MIPTGPRSWADDVTRVRRKVAGAGNIPFNFHDGGVWQTINPRWGTDVNGRAVVAADHNAHLNTSSDILRMRWKADGIRRDVRLRPERLVKFKRSDHTMTTIATASAPSSVTPFGTILYLHNIYPNIDRRLEFFNDAIIDGLVFHQAARDFIQGLGGWAGHWFGSVSDVEVDVNGHEWRDDGGLFVPNDTGRLLTGAMDLRLNGERLFAIPFRDYIEGPTGETWNIQTLIDMIPVRRFLMVRSGRLKLVELFDPAATAIIPPGDISHNATFGNETIESTNTSLQNNIYGSQYTMGSISGTADNISWYVNDRGGTAGNKSKGAVYDTSDNLIGSSDEVTPGSDGAGWQEASAATAFALSASTDYILVAWANFGSNIRFKFIGATQTRWRNLAEDYDTASGAYPDPGGLTTSSTLDASIHVDYTEDSAGLAVGGLATMGVGR